jgi:hypothetical protein
MNEHSPELAVGVFLIAALLTPHGRAIAIAGVAVLVAWGVLNLLFYAALAIYGALAHAFCWIVRTVAEHG